MSPELAMVGLAIVPPIAAVAVVYGRFVRKITKKVQDALADTTNIAEERISNMRTVKMFSQEPKELVKYESSVKNVLKLGYRESKARAIFYGLVDIIYYFTIFLEF